MKKRVPVSQIMSTDLITVTTNQSLYDVERLLNRHNIRHIPVVEGDRLVGVISRSDLLRISFADLTENEENVEAIVYDLYTIPQVMKRVPVTVVSDATIKEVDEIFTNKIFHSMQLVDEGKFLGIDTTSDIINYLLDQY